MKSGFIILILLSNAYFILMKNSEKYAPIELIQSKNDLSLFNIENAKLVLTEVKHGGYRGENQIVMYDSDNYYSTNEYGYEAQINENFEVISLNINVKLLENGYIISGHSLGARKIKENIKIGDYVIFIKESNTAYIFESKDIYKNAYYHFKINNDLLLLNNKMINEDLYEALYDELVEINKEYKKAIEGNNENIIDIYTQTKELCNKYINHKEKIDLSKLNYSKSVKLDKYEYAELFTSEKNVKPQNLIKKINVSHEGGGRLENELVKYDESNIINRNKYGFEIAVDSNGNAIDKKINVELPEKGYILSGHGTSSKLISEIIKIGDYLIYKDLTVSIYRDTNVNVFNNIGKQIQSLIEKYHILFSNKTPLYYDEIAKRINVLISYYNIINKIDITFNIQSYFYFKYFDFDSLFLEIKFLFIESNPVQIQAMWHTPNSLSSIFDESTKEGVQKFLKTCSECGFNRIYVETNSVGTSYYHSDILNSHKIFGRRYGEYKDYLECFIEEAHKLNIEVITWVQVMRARNQGGNLASCYKEEWLSIDYNGEKCTFLDSTNPEVHKFLISQFKEIVNNYNNDGLEYDYIRYEGSNILSYPSTITDFGYTENSIEMFKKKYGYNSSEDIKKILEDKKARTRWVEFKKQRITDLLISSKEELKSIRPNLILTAAVFSDTNSMDSIMQDWPRWLGDELIDYVEPMIYQKDTNYFINTQVPNFISIVKSSDEDYIKNKVIIGLGPVVGGGDYLEYLDQIEYVTSLHHSYNIFCASLTFEFSKLLTTYKNFNYKPISYTSDTEDKVDVLTTDLIKKIENFYSNNSEEDFTELLKSLYNCKKEKNAESINKVLEQIELINDKIIKDNIYNIFIKVQYK
jgi:uncharacterized lipoprotein YddW (UPF0748 family)